MLIAYYLVGLVVAGFGAVLVKRDMARTFPLTGGESDPLEWLLIGLLVVMCAVVWPAVLAVMILGWAVTRLAAVARNPEGR